MPGGRCGLTALYDEADSSKGTNADARISVDRRGGRHGSHQRGGAICKMHALAATATVTARARPARTLPQPHQATKFRRSARSGPLVIRQAAVSRLIGSGLALGLCGSEDALRAGAPWFPSRSMAAASFPRSGGRRRRVVSARLVEGCLPGLAIRRAPPDESRAARAAAPVQV